MASVEPLMKGFPPTPIGKERRDQRFQYGLTGYNDVAWTFIFIMHLLALGFFGLLYGRALIISMGTGTSSDSTYDTKEMKHIIPVFLFSAIVGSIMGRVWLQVMQKCKILTLLYMYIGVEFVVTLILLSQPVTRTSGCIAAIFLIINVIWLFCCAARNIAFAEAIMKPSATAIQDNSGIICISYLMAVFQIIWLMCWSFVAMAIFNHMNPHGQVHSNWKKDIVVFFLLLSLYWTAEVIKNVGHVTTAGSVASWWFLPGSPSQTKNAFVRAITTSFGSICLGSLFVAILKTIEAMLRAAENNARNSDNFVACVIIAITRCFIGCIQGMVEFFNVYVYTHVAVYGESYLQAAKSTMGLFATNGFTLLINENIIDMVLYLGIMVGGIVCAALSGIFALVIAPSLAVPLAIVGFLIGVIMVALVTNAMHSAVATTFVCWAEDPVAMQNGRPNDFKIMNDAANDRYPNWNSNNNLGPEGQPQ